MKYILRSLLASLATLLAVGAALLFVPSRTAAPECHKIDNGANRKACFAAAKSAGEDLAMRGAVAKGGSVWERDLLRLEYVTNDPRLARTLCPDVEGAEAKELCLRVQGRSHLWRSEVTKEGRRGREDQENGRGRAE